jgi:hypothetical protein
MHCSHRGAQNSHGNCECLEDNVTEMTELQGVSTLSLRHLGNLGAIDRITLKLTLNAPNGNVWTRFIWVRIRISDGFIWITITISGRVIWITISISGEFIWSRMGISGGFLVTR